MAVFVCALTLATVAGIFAEGAPFTVPGNANRPECTYEVLSEPGGNTPGTVALIGYKPGPEWSDQSNLTLEREVSSGDATYTVIQLGNGEDPLYSAEGGINPLRSLTVPDSVREIKPNAFKDFVGLGTINGLAENENVFIEENAFYGCFCLNEADLPKIGEENNRNPFGNTVIKDFLEVRGMTLYDEYAENNEVGATKVLINTENKDKLVVRRLFAGHEQSLRLWVENFTSSTILDPEFICDLVNISISSADDVRNGKLYQKSDYKRDAALDNDPSGKQATFIRDSTPVYVEANVGTNLWNDKCMEFLFDCSEMEQDQVIFIVSNNTKEANDPCLTPTILPPFEITESASSVDFTLKASRVKTFRTRDTGTYRLPEGLRKEQGTGTESNTLRVYSEEPMKAGVYTFLVRAAYTFTFHERLITLTVVDDVIPEPPKNLRWETEGIEEEKIKATWDTVKGIESYRFTLYKEGKDEPLTSFMVEQVAGLSEEMISWDATEYIHKNGEGKYYFEVSSVWVDTDNNNSMTVGEPVMSDPYEYKLPSAETKQYTINASASTGGSITPSGIVKVAEGDSQTFTVTAEKDYYLESLKVDGTDVGREDSYTFSDVHADHEIVANFKLIQDSTPTKQLETPKNVRWETQESLGLKRIKATWNRVDNAVSYLVQLYKDEEEVGAPISVDDREILNPSYDFTEEITAKGEGTYYFSVISVGDKENDINSEPVMSGPYAYKLPSAETKQYTINASASTGGSITPSGTVKVAEGDSQTFTVTAEKDYYLESLVVDGKNEGRKNSYTFSDVNADHEIVANFKAIQNRIGDVKASYPVGENVSFTAYGDGMENTSPKEGDIRWKPESWNIDDKSPVDFERGETTGTIEASDLTAGKHSIQVIFAMQEYNGTEWVTVASAPYDTRTAEFQVEGTSAGEDPTKEPDEDQKDPTDPADPDASTTDDPTDPDASSGEKSDAGTTENSGIAGLANTIVDTVRTSDPMQLALWIGAFAVSAFCLFSFAGGRTGRRAERGAPPVDCHQSSRRKKQ